MGGVVDMESDAVVDTVRVEAYEKQAIPRARNRKRQMTLYRKEFLRGAQRHILGLVSHYM